MNTETPLVKAVLEIVSTYGNSNRVIAQMKDDYDKAVNELSKVTDNVDNIVNVVKTEVTEDMISQIVTLRLLTNMMAEGADFSKVKTLEDLRSSIARHQTKQIQEGKKV